MGSGLIYLAIVIVWAAILIPMFLRSRDAAMEDRSVERFDHAMAILSQQEEAELPQPNRDGVAAHAVPRRKVAVNPQAEPKAKPVAHTAPRSPKRRPSTARRRARTLLFLLGLTVVLTAVAVFTVVPMWAPLPVAALLVSFVVHLRNQAIRAERRRKPTHHQTPGRATDDAAPQHRSAPAKPAQTVTPQRTTSTRREFVPGPSRAVVVETKGASGVTTADIEQQQDEDAWRPNPLPLPTYVTAPKAVRPIKVIDLTTPGAWTSGRLFDEDVALEDVLAEEIAADQLDELLEHEVRPAPEDDSSRRAVGD